MNIEECRYCTLSEDGVAKVLDGNENGAIMGISEDHSIIVNVKGENYTFKADRCFNCGGKLSND